MDSSLHTNRRSGEALLLDARDPTVRCTSPLLHRFVPRSRRNPTGCHRAKYISMRESKVCAEFWAQKVLSRTLSLLLSFSCRFRQEYRIERKLQSSSSVASPTSVLNDEDLWEVPQSLSTRRRGISRVVVLHNDTLATFSSPETLNGASADGINESVAVPDTTSTDQGAEQASDFFDTPEFWSGSITWW